MEVSSPVYGIKYYTPSRYKIIKYSSFRGCRLPADPHTALEDRQDGKFAQAYSRARSVIFQVAICNDWDYFCTFTIDPSKYDRYSFKPFYKAFTQWLRDYRKKYCCRIEYLLIPELHKDDAWHLHGFIRGIPSDHLSEFVSGIHPQDLVDGGYRNWGRYSSAFGFCSLAPLRDHVRAAGYVTKYITKDLLRSNSSYGAHLYMCSIGLKRAVSLGYVCSSNAYLESLIDYRGQFASSGWAVDVSWSDIIPLIDVWCTAPVSSPSFDYGEDIDHSFFDFYEQLNIAGWCNGNIGLSS